MPFMKERDRLTRRTALIGISANLLLLAGKLTVGLAARSQGMIADGLNSFGDVFNAFMTLVGGRLASRPEDDEHPWGHGKAEFIATFIIALSMLLIALLTFRSSLLSLLHQTGFHFSIWLMLTALLTMLIKAGLYLLIRKYWCRTQSLLVRAALEDHRNDIFLSAGTAAGVLAGSIGILWLDGIVGISISLWIAFTGLKILLPSFNVLMDSPIGDEFIETIRTRVRQIPGISHIDAIQSKPVGARYLLFIKVSVAADMSVMDSHGIAAEIRSQLKDYHEVADTIVHINPVLSSEESREKPV